jgi:dTDP-4-amino-4,6-dideoxygalactose transaminase
MAHKARLMRDHGRNGTDVEMWGTNSRLDTLQAAILLHKIKTFPKVIARRREIAAMYHEGLSGIQDLTLPPAPNSDPDHFDTFQNYEIEAGKRDQLEIFLKDNGIKTIRQWGGKAVHQFTKLGFTDKLPYTEKLMQRMFMLPMNVSLSDDDIAYVVKNVRDFYK